MYGYASKDEAEKRCAELNARAHTKAMKTEYRVERYPNGTNDRESWPWGICRYFQHSDRPELGWVLVGFVPKGVE